MLKSFLKVACRFFTPRAPLTKGGAPKDGRQTAKRSRMFLETLEDRMAPAADLGVLAYSPSPIPANGDGAISVIVYNAGQDTAKDNMVQVALPSTLRYAPPTLNSNVITFGNQVWMRINDLPGGTSQTFSVPVHAMNMLSAHVAQTSVTARTFGSQDANPGNDSFKASTLITPSADLTLTGSGPVTANVGTLARYYFNVSNRGSSATVATLSVPVPSGMMFNPAQSTTGWKQVGNVVYLQTPNLSARQLYSPQVTFSVLQNTPNGTVATVSAQLAGTLSDPNFGNNQVVIKTTIRNPVSSDLRLLLTGPANVIQGDKAAYAVQVNNLGQQYAAQDVVVTVPVPTGFDLDGVRSPGWRRSGNNAVLNIGTLASNTGQSFTLVFNTGNVPAGTQALFSASVTSTTADPNGANNAASVLTRIDAPVLNGSMSYAVRSTGSFDTAVKNQKNVVLLRLEAYALDRNTFTTALRFVVEKGSPNNMQNYSLWVDTNNDGKVDKILQSGVSAQLGRLTFDQLLEGGYETIAGQTTVYEVHADVSASLTDNQLQLRLDTSASDYIKAQDSKTGTSLAGIKTDGVGSGFITVTTTPSIVFSLVSQGDLYVTKDYTPVRSRQLLGGQLSDVVFRLRFHAENEDVDVYKLAFQAMLGYQGIDRLELYLEGALTPFASATIGGTGSDVAPAGTFTAHMQSRQLVIPKGSDVIVLVRVRVKTDVDGAFSGEDFQLRLSGKAVANSATGEGAVHARGDVSSNTLLANAGGNGSIHIGTNTNVTPNSDIVSEKNVVTLFKFGSLTNASPDANGTSVPTGIADFGQIKFAGLSAFNSKSGLNKGLLNGLIWNVNSSNVEMDANSFYLYNKADSTVKAHGIAYDLAGNVLTGTITGSYYVVFTDLQNSSVNTTVDQGSDIILVLQGKITNPKVSASATSALQASITSFSDPTLAAFGIFKSHIEWLDLDGAGIKKYWWIEYPETVIKSTSYQS